MNPSLSTFMHIAELASAGFAALALAYAAHRLLGVDLSGPLVAFLTLAMSGLAKFARSSPSVPVPDYVNEPRSED